MDKPLMKFKFACVVVTAMALIACDNPPDYQNALYNYSKDMCEGKLKSVNTWNAVGESGYTCITAVGVEFRKVQMHKIPVQYWEILNDAKP